MKRIYSFLFAILTLAATTGVFTSCQEDAPEIDYTINITVNNDFTEVIDAINNGTMKQEAAIAALTAAINGMNGEQNEKMDAIVKAINDLAKTTDAKLAIIEAAMKAQTLALEAKLDLLTAAVKAQTLKQEEMGKLLATAIDNLGGTLEEKLAAIEAIIESTSATLAEKIAAVEAAMKAQTLALEAKLDLLTAAVKALPNYTDQLQAIEAAIKGMPDYSDKLGAIEAAIKALPNYTEKLGAIEAAIKALPNYTEKMGALETALEAIAANIEAQEGQYADELEDLKTSIDDITAAVAAGNKSQADALAEIIALLKSGAIAGGGGGSGSGGEGGEGDEPIGPYILLKTENPKNSIIEFACYESELKNMSGVAGLEIIDATDGEVTKYRGILTEQEVKLYGMFTEFHCSGQKLKKIETKLQGAVLEILMLDANPDLEYDFTSNTKLKYLDLRSKKLEISEVEDLVKKLPHTLSSGAECWVYCSWMGETINKCVKDADAKGWLLHLLIP